MVKTTHSPLTISITLAIAFAIPLWFWFGKDGPRVLARRLDEASSGGRRASRRRLKARPRHGPRSESEFESQRTKLRRRT